MTDQSTTYSIWQTDIPRLALDHPFLLHGLLALAAMHLHHTSPAVNQGGSVYAEVASLHQDLALAEYRAQLQTINENNCHALFAFSFVLGALSYAFVQQPSDADDKDFITSITDVFDLLVGSKMIILEALAWLRKGKLAPFLVQQALVDVPNISPVYDALNLSLDGLSQEIDQTHGGAFDYFTNYAASEGHQLGCGPIYQSGISGLKKIIASSSMHEGAISRVIGWPVVTDVQFIARLRHGDVVALVILAHYGAVLCSINHVWWAAGLGSRLIRAVAGVVGSGYHSKYMREPLAWA